MTIGDEVLQNKLFTLTVHGILSSRCSASEDCGFLGTDTIQFGTQLPLRCQSTYLSKYNASSLEDHNLN